ncbi:DNA mismatch repair protein Msh3 isoform X2 [Boleophthalmus pectinirostris]|uniref:DNA mismatch repair protein Msh3 isoform X2 n=1 Tax=Boleophthalmus pectinirostris TaxID=150288 RepID=UPI00242C57C2|nr:DNA mismatch repair protein Msh3 isoform X2 [Boleophthalmus pectinirostris]
MRKCVKKSCTAQSTISAYFEPPSSATTTECKDKQNASNPLAFKNKHKRTSTSKFDSNNNGPGCGPSKRFKLPLRKQEEEKESTRNNADGHFLSTIDGGLCTSTLEKLRGFACKDDDAHIAIQKDGTGAGICEFQLSGSKQGNEMEKVETEKNKAEEDYKTSLVLSSFSQFASPGVERKSREPCLLADRTSPPRCSKSVYTPLEQQVIDLKLRHQDVLLAIECGYKYRFFGEDAEIAAKILSVSCYSDHNFMTCCIPTHRLFVHVRRLVAHGHKVGVVKQTETSAIKASGANKNALFTRELTALYTKSTLVGEDVNPVCKIEDIPEVCSDGPSMDPPHSFLLCISENWDKQHKQLTVGLVAVQPSTGDVFLDSFSDSSSRSELEARILKINPVEILVSSDLSELTLKLLHSITTASPHADDRARLETRDSAQFEFTTAMNTVTKFYTQSQDKDSHSLSSVASLESPVICCLGPLIQFLKEFKLERVLGSECHFQHLLSGSETMTLGAATLKNLEILRNQTDGLVKGSLLWVLDHTHTAFGRRLMRKWVSQPLMDPQSISDRLDAVQELLESDSVTLTSLKSLLWHLPDVERGICSIYHRKCSTQEFYLVTSALSNVGYRLEALLPAAQSQVTSPLLQSLLFNTPELLAPAHGVIKVLNENAAKSGNKTELFSDLSGFPVLQDRKEQIQAVFSEIQEHIYEVRMLLKNPSLSYKTVSGQEFLIEVRNSQVSTIPTDWTIVSSTKTMVRYHSPFLVEHYKKLQQLREQLQLDCQREWIRFLDQFGEHYHTIKRAISHLATMDCLFSLAEVAKQGDYCRPVVNSSDQLIMIRNGRHPIIDLLMGEQSQYVPNDTELQIDSRRAMVITGPNMGGKSSYIRQVALICIMAQMGSYVPATEARLGLLDGIYTRMGASDNIYSGRSTFMHELSEASDIIFRATERSLVILDELGRGTSTHDGIAIAYATLEYFITQVKSFTLFVTHYLLLSELEQLYPQHVFNCHMAFLINDPDVASADDEVRPEFITFLYQLTGGAAERSYGLNVARLANIPDAILNRAAHKARELENTVNNKRKNKKLITDLWKISDKNALMEWQMLSHSST